MKKWYAFLSGKKMIAAGLAALVVLTSLLGVSFYRANRSNSLDTAKETMQETEGMALEESGDVLAEEMNHELPNGEEVGEQQLANDGQEELAAEEAAAAPSQAAAPELEEVAEQSNLISMNLNYDGTKKLQWPVAGRELVKDYSMDSLVYYATLEEYKVCPAIMVQASPGDAVLAPGDGLVTEISANEEIGNYICLKLGEQFEAVIGNLDNISVSLGDYLLKGTVLGGLAEPTKYYVTEGPNVYLELLKDGEPVDPLDYLE